MSLPSNPRSGAPSGLAPFPGADARGADHPLPTPVVQGSSFPDPTFLPSRHRAGIPTGHPLPTARCPEPCFISPPGLSNSSRLIGPPTRRRALQLGHLLGLARLTGWQLCRYSDSVAAGAAWAVEAVWRCGIRGALSAPAWLGPWPCVSPPFPRLSERPGFSCHLPRKPSSLPLPALGWSFSVKASSEALWAVDSQGQGPHSPQAWAPRR